jgi:glycosyltransferase involved in cell wall biosynthesis
MYDRRVMALLPEHGVTPRVLALPGSFPFPSQADLEATRAALDSVPAHETILADGLAWGAFAPSLASGIRARVVALCHHPLGLEAGLTSEQARAFIDNERAMLALSDHVIVSSRTTRDTLADMFAVPRDKITVAEPGVDRAPRARGGGEKTVSIIAVGSIVPRKGYDVLVEALSGLADLDWRLRIVGALDRAPPTVAALEARIAASGLAGRIELVGAADDVQLAKLYDASDLFVSASRYEGYGMVLAEAMVRGLPLVSTTGGAAAETVPDDAAIKVPPDDAGALADGLRRAISGADLRARLAAAALEASRGLPTWDSAAKTIAQALHKAHRKKRR